MENATGDGGWRRPVGDYLRRWKWQIGAAILVVLAVGWIGYRSSPTFVGDFAANFVADAIVAVVAFAIATVAFGLWERREQQREARQKALRVLRKELEHNLADLARLIDWAEEGGEQFLSAYSTARPEYRPRVRTQSWDFLVASGLVSDLPQDVGLSLVESYFESTEAVRNLVARSFEAFMKSKWPELVDECLPELEKARGLTQDALDKLKKGLPHGE